MPMTRLLHALILAALGAVVVYGVVAERHTVRSLTDGEPQDLRGPEFTAGATYDGYLRRTDGLYDVYSLQPKVAQEKDCKT